MDDKDNIYGLFWDELAPHAKAFTVMTDDRREIAWLRQAWQHLAAAGLTDNEAPMERTRSVMRFLALGRAYYMFANLLLEQGEDEPSFGDALEGLAAPAFHVALLLDRDDLEDSGDVEDLDELEWISDESEFVSVAVPSLVRAARSEVWEALVKGFGGEHALYASMYLAVHGCPPDEDDDDEDRSDLDEGDALSDVTAATLEAHEFVSNGFQR